MVFSSVVFLFAFLPVVFLVYSVLPSLRWKNLFLVAASLIFYAYGEPVYVIVMLISSVINHVLGLLAAGRGGGGKPPSPLQSSWIWGSCVCSSTQDPF